MNDNWLVFGGWSLPPHFLCPIFGNESAYVDVNELFPQIIQGDHLNEQWASLLYRCIKDTMQTPVLNIAGWSTGVFFAYALARLLHPQRMVLLSATPSFCKRDNFQFGQDSTMLKAMRRQLRRNKVSGLRNFQQQCGLSEYLPVAESYSLEALISGLVFLEKINLFPLNTMSCSTFIFHGKEDGIVSYQAAEVFQKEMKALIKIVPGSHTFFLNKNAQETIRNVL